MKAALRCDRHIDALDHSCPLRKGLETLVMNVEKFSQVFASRSSQWSRPSHVLNFGMAGRILCLRYG
jgi:hypothetical protein